MGFGKTITTLDLFQLMLIYLKLSGEIEWHWLTVLAPLGIIFTGGTLLYITGLVALAAKKGRTDER